MTGANAGDAGGRVIPYPPYFQEYPCPVCGQGLRWSGRGRPPTYCTVACRDWAAGHRKMQDAALELAERVTPETARRLKGEVFRLAGIFQKRAHGKVQP